jgi:2-polyprenyl-3-methyl-5-hydroxy-6-metoxy-1,4-benzoquinol methylase
MPDDAPDTARQSGFSEAAKMQGLGQPASANEETLQAYEGGVAQYNEAAIPEVEGSVKDWVDKSLSLIRPGGHVLEIGSAHGRDAAYIESLGFTVDRTDAAQAFVDYMRQGGHDARMLNVLTEENYGGPFDMVYANAVLLHFTPEESAQVLERARESLSDDGILAFSVKIGEGAAWSDRKLDGRRYFTYWQEGPLRELVTSAGYEVLEMPEGQTGHDNGDWYHVIARKRQETEVTSAPGD